MEDFGWLYGQEHVLFQALDTEASGVLRREHFRWLDLEYRRIQKKIDAKSQAIHSLRKQQANEAHEETLSVFKQTLIKKHGNLVRAWRIAFASNDQLSIPKPQFLKACATMGFAHEAKDLYKMMDKDHSGFASLEELDPLSADHLAKFKRFLEKKFGSCQSAFESMESDTRKISWAQFENEVKDWGWANGGIKKIFQHLDRDGRKILEESDFRFLDKWTPSPFFLAEANVTAKEEVKELLNQKYNGHFMKAWTHLLDKTGSNRVNWSEFQAACQKLRYHGDIAGAWRAFDTDLSGYLTLNEVDTEASDTLCEFKNWTWEEFGTVRAAFGVFDHDNSNSLSFEEFRSNCRIYGYDGNARKLFDALDMNGEKMLSMSEIAFLDDWDMGQKQEGKSKEDQRKSHIRQVNESLQHYEMKNRPKRLTELSSFRFINTIKENASTASEENDSERSQKVTQVKQSLQLRADLPLIPFYHWPGRRLGGEEETHCPYHCELRKGRERKHWVQEAAPDFVPSNGKELPPPSVLPDSLPGLASAVTRPLLKPTLDELLYTKGRRLLWGGMVPRLPSVPKLMNTCPEPPHTVR